MNVYFGILFTDGYIKTQKWVALEYEHCGDILSNVAVILYMYFRMKCSHQQGCAVPQYALSSSAL